MFIKFEGDSGHRFPIGTNYRSSGKHPRICTVEDQMTVLNSNSEVAYRYYTTYHFLNGQKVYEYKVCETTIARAVGVAECRITP